MKLVTLWMQIMEPMPFKLFSIQKVKLISFLGLFFVSIPEHELMCFCFWYLSLQQHLWSQVSMHSGDTICISE